MLGLIALAACLQVPAPPGGSSDTLAPLRAERQAIVARESEALALLAGKLEPTNVVGAKAIRRAIEPGPPANGSIRFVPLPEVVPPPPRKQLLPPEAVKVRSTAAQSLFDLARRAAAAPARRYSLADACLRGVLDRDPRHAEARRLLGYVPFEGGWATPHAVQMRKKGMVLDPTFGWVDASWVPHLERGELPGKRFDSRGQPTEWLPAEQADALRSDFDAGWQINTAPHFEVRTDNTLAEGVAFARRLEGLHDLFFAVFADVLAAGRSLPLAQRFDRPSQPPTLPAHKYQVWYFAGRDEYQGFFARQFQMDEGTSLGYYMPPSEARKFRAPPRSYFFKDPDGALDAEATLYHEGSHQLLFETGGSKITLNRGNFWVWEGLGTYLETARPQPDGSIQLGAPTGARFAEAVRQIVKEGQYVPIAELVAMDNAQFIARPGVFLNYAESMALTVFLMNADDGAHRGPFLDYVTDALLGRATSRKRLQERLGISYEELDAKFQEYLKAAAKPEER